MHLYLASWSQYFVEPHVTEITASSLLGYVSTSFKHRLNLSVFVVIFYLAQSALY